MDTPLCGKFQSIIDRGHHLNNWKGGVSLCLTHDCCALTISSWACCLALLNWSTHNVTCGIGDGLSVQSAHGLNPYSTKKGDSPVVSFGQLLCTNSARGK